MEILRTENGGRLNALADAAFKGVQEAGTEEELKDTRMIVLVLDVPSDKATIATGNYEDRKEAALDISLLVKALQLDA